MELIKFYITETRQYEITCAISEGSDEYDLLVYQKAPSQAKILCQDYLPVDSMFEIEEMEWIKNQFMKCPGFPDK